MKKGEGPGRPKKAMEKERETMKNKQKMPFEGEKTLFLLKTKKIKEPKKNKKNPKKQIRRV